MAELNETMIPESDISEWKSSWHDEYLKWIAAFANTDGGTLNIGVNDDGYVLGLRDHRTLLEGIPNKIRDKLHITPKVRLKYVDHIGENIRYPDGVPAYISSKDANRYACGIFVPKSEKDEKKLDAWQKETSVIQDSDGRYYYIEIVVEPLQDLVFCDGIAYTRSGSTLQILSGLELEKAVMKSSGRTWDSFVVNGKDVSDLDADAIKVLRKKAVDNKRLTPYEAGSSDRKLMEEMGLLDVDGGLTRAALMLFSNPERIVTGSYIKIGFFAPVGSYGENKINDIIYQDTVHGPLITQADKAIDILYTKYMKALISYNGIQRVESYIIPQDAMREVILNAIAHKNYPSGNPIQIKVYDDHITVMNEGFWPFDRLNVSDVYDKEHDSYPINPLIAEGLYTAGDIESWGTGFNKIRSACNRYGCPLPVIEATNGSVTMRINASQEYLDLLANLNGDKDKESADKSAESADYSADNRNKTDDLPTSESADLSDRERQILDTMESDTEYTSVEVSEKIGLKGSRTRQLLKGLVDKGLLRSTRSTKGNRYIKRGV